MNDADSHFTITCAFTTRNDLKQQK